VNSFRAPDFARASGSSAKFGSSDGADDHAAATVLASGSAENVVLTMVLLGLLGLRLAGVHR
jgi:hypothetical protein